MKKNLIAELSFSFSLKAIQLFKILSEEREYVISKQVLRSATSIGANIEEANAAFSRKEFAYKISISLKEARETRYWLRLLDQSKLAKTDLSEYLSDIETIINILTKIYFTLIAELKKGNKTSG